MGLRQIQVGWASIQTPSDRALLAAAGTYPGVDELLEHAKRPPDLGKYWCGACGEDLKQDDHFMLRRVYRTAVPEGAECCECFISLQEVADGLTSLFSKD